jgi:hypothetical protein
MGGGLATRARLLWNLVGGDDRDAFSEPSKERERAESTHRVGELFFEASGCIACYAD